MTMKTWALCATLLTTFGFGAQTATAQSGGVPTNFPPASYKGSQFVDNAGCVFVRAGYDGNVTWVPRVSRSRKQICGQTPTLKGQTRAAAAPAAARANAPAPKQITAAPPAATAPAATTRRTAATSAASAPRVITAPQTIRAPASKPVAAQPPRVVRRVPAAPAPQAPQASTTVRIPAREACLNGQATRQVGNRTVTMRCGPQTTPHVTVIRRGDAPTGKNVYYNRNSWEDSQLRGQTRIVPRHVYENKDAQIAHVPAGYRPAWSDDRLNPYRAIQTVQGYTDTQQVWTNQVPRRLVHQPAQRQPFPKNLWTRRYKHEIKTPNTVYRANDTYPPASVQVAYAAQAGYRDAAVSTRQSNPAQGGGFVEIGVFSTEAKAQAAAARLSSAGFRVRQSATRHNGQAMQRLRVGPYGSDVALKAALAAVHGTGYTQAYTR